ncbi:exopolysaccharide biosynthesis polyprenyl glycosylphosphotransferase [Flavobacterium cellulosilyticum]|uniref:Exopolysaccharide biosynthesis polyprenyl glycosylphosphotransferase n=1 Tax=Flavobacterium cellulosilyticum TaxID=2541731 RepID=A0A4R5CDF3_9FLAO|nr:exopolysaccharide biosynthesis polyprenyl glycosylphosphotransferase [Flavobacterium cellulosilyticum]TDD95204.1 exopolysaccharide biosynthesis polyprenyl glycosylphosphotransferase [Flavobacterium cellulosilyticum]
MTKNNKIHFEVSERKVLLRIFDVIFVWSLLRSTGNFLDLNYLETSSTNFYYAIVLAIYINVIGTVFEMYSLHIASNQFKILKSCILTASTSVLFYLLTPVLSAELPNNRIQILLFYFTVLFALVLWRTIYVKFLASSRFVQNVVLICDQEQVEELIQALEKSDPHYRVVAYVNTVTNKNGHSTYHFVKNIEIANIVDFINDTIIFEIVIASKKTEDITVELYQVLLLLLESGTNIREYNQVFEDKVQRIPVQFITRDFYKFFPFSRSNYNKLYQLNIKIMETVISIIGLLFGLIFLPFIIIGNAIGNPGKLFYTQERVGKHGKIFQIIKFRTMVINAEKNGAVFSTPNDSRVTVFGKFLRKTRIDEIPQFINILKGEMAVIGPRPERPIFVKEISEIMPFYETRHVIKPGLTGWAQVNYVYGISIEDSLIKLQYDLYYIKHRSVFLDLNITIKTISTVLFYRGQ